MNNCKQYTLLSLNRNIKSVYSLLTSAMVFVTFFRKVVHKNMFENHMEIIKQNYMKIIEQNIY